MSEGGRPGGLTALAVVNFIIGGFAALGVLMVIGADAVSGGEVSKELGNAPKGGLMWLLILLRLAAMGLIIASGVGYLGLKRVLGRTVGNAYAVTDLAHTAVAIAVVGFQFMALIGFVYPVLTLALINTTFKDDLVY